MTKLWLAKTCSTCILSMFKPPKYSYYRSRGKKQLGICMGLCNGRTPEVGPVPFDVDCRPDDVNRAYGTHTLYEVAVAGKAPNKETYMQYFERDMAGCGLIVVHSDGSTQVSRRARNRKNIAPMTPGFIASLMRCTREQGSG